MNRFFVLLILILISCRDSNRLENNIKEKDIDISSSGLFDSLKKNNSTFSKLKDDTIEVNQKDEESINKLDNAEKQSIIVSNCKIPIKIKAYLKENKIKYYDERNMMMDWQENPYAEGIVCPTMIEIDFTNDGREDFLIVADYEDFPNIILFDDFENTNGYNVNFATSVKVYAGTNKGELVIGSAFKKYEGKIKFPKNSVIIYNFESSVSVIYYQNGNIIEEYIGD